MILVVYQSPKKTRYRLLKFTFLKPGDITSMGWLVLTVQHYYKNRFFTQEEYRVLCEKDYKRFTILLNRKQKVKKIISFLYYITH